MFISPLDKIFLEALNKCMIDNGDGTITIRTTTIASTGAHSGQIRRGDLRDLAKNLFADNGDGTFSLRIT